MDISDGFGQQQAESETLAILIVVVARITEKQSRVTGKTIIERMRFFIVHLSAFIIYPKMSHQREPCSSQVWEGSVPTTNFSGIAEGQSSVASCPGKWINHPHSNPLRTCELFGWILCSAFFMN